MISLIDFLARLNKVENKGGGQYMACCPAHDDHHPSMAVRMGEKKIVCECLSHHCSYEDILAAMGLKWNDVIKPEYLAEYRSKAVPGKKRTSAAKKTDALPGGGEKTVEKPDKPVEKKPADLSRLRVGGAYTTYRSDSGQGGRRAVKETITREYTYEDAEGQAVLKVFRTDAKSFPVVHLDKGKWWWGDGGNSDILYRLPKVLSAIGTGERVYVVEGEKDVETMERLGYVATTNKGGASTWGKKATEALAGAVVAIIPDVDEAGKKHGYQVAKALDGVAKEVRLMNLKRVGAELPDKGDVSDLASLLGDDGAREALGKLLDASPVLSRIVSDDDYADYFEGIRGCRVNNGCICGFSNGDWVPLCNFVALPVEQVLLDDGSGTPRYDLSIMGWSSMGYRLPTLHVGIDKFDAMQWPMLGWCLAANVYEGNGTRPKLRRMIQEAGIRAAVHRIKYCHTGWRFMDGHLCYLHGAGAIGADDTMVQLDYGFSERYALGGLRSGPWLDYGRDGYKPLCMGAALRVIGAATKRVGVPVVGFMFLNPLRYFLEQRGHRPSFIPFIRGKSGTGKTTFASLCMNFFGYDFGFESAAPATFEDSAAGISLKLYQLKDMPLLIDDGHPEVDPQRARAKAAMAELVSRMIGDGMRRSRMKADITAQEDKPARGLVIETGELLPRISPSGIARLYVIDVAKGDVPLPDSHADAVQKDRIKEMNELHKLARQGALNECMRGYIEWLAGRADALPDLLEERYAELQAQALERVDGAHARLPTAVAYLMLGIRMMLDYMSEPDGLLSPDDVPEMMDEYWHAIIGNANEQVREMLDDSPTVVYVNTIRELLQSGRCVVQDLNAVPASIAPPGLIGYRDTHYYYLNPGQTFGAVQRSLADQCAPMPFGKNTVMRMLAEEKKLVQDPNGRNVRQINRGGIHAWMMWVPRYVIDGTEPEERTEQLSVAEADKDNPFVKGEDA